MPFITILDYSNGVVIHEGHGPISFEDIRSRLTSCFGEKGVPYHSLWDLRDASLNQLNRDEIMALAGHARIHAQQNAGRSNAWVVAAPADFGLCRMLEMRTGGDGLRFGVFHEFEEAKKWLAT